ncbi:Bifunctional coenzyme A synthase [Holothuria leucospilota]|uniref:Bifunctional coenzyme A synthase n=1 Tax=Holothuria leucospilota TaxID=206669 RepID=A0A9Q0YNW2_HOLLE|nr:Bifunctional coenzyme A synthase [Holothuria leucospilota]
MAVNTGLLLLTSPTHLLSKKVPAILNFISQKITKVLYVHLHPDLERCLSSEHETQQDSCIPPSYSILHFATNFYVESAKIRGFPDTRILLRNLGGRVSCSDIPLLHSIQNVYTDSTLPPADISTYLKNWMLYPSDTAMHRLPDDILQSLKAKASSRFSETEPSNKMCKQEEEFKTYSHVVLGGTFDRLHVGHKVLLTESAMRANHKVTVGVTDGAMNHKKILHELIQPCQTRIDDVYNFLWEVKPWIAHKDIIVPIVDPFGPSIVEVDMGCIVVSQETKKGGAAVNKRRVEKGLSVLDVHEIDIVADINHEEQEEDKVSSSSQRMRLLGTLLKQPIANSNMLTSPYIIGLTGGIASGKSSVCQRLEKLGAAVIDCDKLGHQAYQPDAAAFQKVVDEFGKDIVGDDGQINRKALGAKVFADKSRLTVLNKIVWPEIARMAQDLISSYAKEGKDVCILDAAVLLDANWDEFTHEVWSCIIPKEEALKRIIDRDGLSEERARQRIESQMSNQERVARSHVVMCTLWEPEYTQKQVEKAWKALQERKNLHSSGELPASQL